MAKSKSGMNKFQKYFLSNYTCGILDRYYNMEEQLKEHGIPRKHLRKMKEAFDLIFEVNQCCFAKKNGA